MRRQIVAAVLSVVGVGSANAGTYLDHIDALTQSEFRALSEDLGAALTYRPLTPTAPLGTTGFDIGVEVTYTDVKNKAAWDVATGGNAPSGLVVPRIHAVKGLPFGIDIGAIFAAVPDSDIKSIGGEVRWAIISGGAVAPAVGVRLGYQSLSGVSMLDLNTTTLDVSISKGFAFLTPYAGAGIVRTNSNPQGLAKTAGRTDEQFDESRVFLGLNMNFAFINFCFEGDKTGSNTTYGAKVGWRF
jgi:hypothetical protein